MPLVSPDASTAAGRSSGEVCHLLNRANARATIFAVDADFMRFEELLAEEQEAAGVQLYAWCLMPTHWHLVARPDAPGGLTRLMRRLARRHTQLWHKVRGTRGQGHLYQGRYKAFAVQSDDHFLTVCRYVERNPLRAGLVTRAADWRFGSLWRLGRHRVPPHPDPWPVPRPRRWAEVVDGAETPAELEALRTSLARGRPFGDASWIRLTAARFTLGSTMRPPGRPPRRNATPES
jgi:putative transposase